MAYASAGIARKLVTSACIKVNSRIVASRVFRPWENFRTSKMAVTLCPFAQLQNNSSPGSYGSNETQLFPRGPSQIRAKSIIFCKSTTFSTFSPANDEISINIELSVHDDYVPTDEENVKRICSQLKSDAANAVRIATSGLEDVDSSEEVELSIVLCGDSYIQELNNEWLGIDEPTDVLSFPQNQTPGLHPTYLLGDLVISLDKAATQAEERGHSLLDELRILLVHGLLHLIGYDHETGEDDKREMMEEEQRIMTAMKWAGKGLIENAMASAEAGLEETKANPVAYEEPTRKLPLRKSFFRYLFCDMDGTLLNSQSRVSASTAAALRAAKERGVTIIIATGKARPAAMAALGAAGLTGDGGVVTLNSPGVFIQGLRVYGQGGSVVHNSLLPVDICREGFEFSAAHGTALIGFSGDRCVTLADHPLVEKLHSTYYEPRAMVMRDIEHLMAETPIQKLLFYDSPEGISGFIRPHWSAAASQRATVTQAVDDMLEILPLGASKGSGVQVLLDHLGVPAEQIMAIGDGENDLEMIDMAGFGVAMANGSPKTKAVANAIVSSNDDDGVAEAIERYILI